MTLTPFSSVSWTVFGPQLLEAFGWPDDAEHRALVYQVVREVFSKQAPDAEIIEQE